MAKGMREHYVIVVGIRPKGGRYRATISNGVVHYDRAQADQKLEELRALDPSRADNYQVVPVMLP
jgi:hypothetical protein